jgi:hypothetical protein
MRRGYTREAYVSLIQKAKEIIPGVTISRFTSLELILGVLFMNYCFYFVKER